MYTISLTRRSFVRDTLVRYPDSTNFLIIALMGYRTLIGSLISLSGILLTSSIVPLVLGIRLV